MRVLCRCRSLRCLVHRTELKHQNSRKISFDPVLSVRHTLFKIMSFFRRPKIDPLTNGPLKSQRVVPNRALKSAIETFTHAT